MSQVWLKYLGHVAYTMMQIIQIMQIIQVIFLWENSVFLNLIFDDNCVKKVW